MTCITTDLLSVYDKIQRVMQQDTVAAMANLVKLLYQQRKCLIKVDWQLYIKLFRDTPLFKSLMEDPLTRHSFVKPRGYPGDAELLDYLYRAKKPESTKLGKSICRCCVDHGISSAAVRERAALIGMTIDNITSECDNPRILSVASGHMRELDLSKSFVRGEKMEILALDQDPLSLLKVEDLGDERVSTLRMDIARLIAGRSKIEGQFNLIYSSGLYDYLSDRVATRLTSKMFEYLKPGGSMLMTNFLPDILSSGYLEAAMDWWLVYRTGEQLMVLTDDIPESKISGIRLFRDSFNNVAYCEVKKKA